MNLNLNSNSINVLSNWLLIYTTSCTVYRIQSMVTLQSHYKGIQGVSMLYMSAIKPFFVLLEFSFNSLQIIMLYGMGFLVCVCVCVNSGPSGRCVCVDLTPVPWCHS